MSVEPFKSSKNQANCVITDMCRYELCQLTLSVLELHFVDEFYAHLNLIS